MATDPRALLNRVAPAIPQGADRLAAQQFNNAGIVPVQRTPVATTPDPRVQNMIDQRIAQMPPARLDQGGIVPSGEAQQKLALAASLGAPGATNPQDFLDRRQAQFARQDARWDDRLGRWQEKLATLPEQVQPRFQEAIDRRVARHDMRVANRTSRAARIAEIMANRPARPAVPAQPQGLLGAGGMPQGPWMWRG